MRLSPTAGLKFGDLFVVCVSIKEIGHVPKRELLQQRAQKESPTHGLFVSRAGDEIFAGDEGAGFVHIAGLAKWRDYILAPGCVLEGSRAAGEVAASNRRHKSGRWRMSQPEHR